MVFGVAQVDELTDMKLEHIVSGDDAVQFFAHHEGQARVKFFYLNLAPCGRREYKPYDLVVCKRIEVNDEYFTISNSGVTHIEPAPRGKRKFLEKHISYSDVELRNFVNRLVTNLIAWNLLQGMWPYCGRVQLYRQFRQLDRLGNHLVCLPIAKGCQFKFQIRI